MRIGGSVCCRYWVSGFGICFGGSRFLRGFCVICVIIVRSFVYWVVLFVELFPGRFCDDFVVGIPMGR